MNELRSWSGAPLTGRIAAPMTTTTADPLHTDGTGVLRDDPWLERYVGDLRSRHEHLKHYLRKYQSDGGLMGPISQGHKFFGFNRGELWNKPGVWYREWAPAALRSEEHTSELQSPCNLVCRLLLEKKNKCYKTQTKIDYCRS